MDYSRVVEKVKRSIALIASFDSKNELLGTGSGFVFSKKGILVTCNHVVKDTNSLVIKFPDSAFIGAKVVLKDEEHDLALLKFDDETREPLEMGDVSLVKEGVPVFFSGYPLSAQDLTTHQGILSAIIKDATGLTSYLIDGTVNSGNSGCPLMDSNGKVIGVVDAKRRVRNDLLEKVERMSLGAMSLHGIDMVEIYQALSNNVQIGMGHAVPVFYIPDHKTAKFIEDTIKNQESNKPAKK